MEVGQRVCYNCGCEDFKLFITTSKGHMDIKCAECGYDKFEKKNP